MKWKMYSEKDVAKTYATNLRHFRQEVHMTQEEVAAKLKLSTPAYRAYENTTHPKFPRPDTLTKICNLFEKNIHEFFYFNEPLTPRSNDTELTVREENDIEDAIKNLLQPGDTLDCDLKYTNGKIVARHRIFGTFTIPTKELAMCLKMARESYRGSLAGQIENSVHFMERNHVYKKETVLFDEMLTKQCGMNYDCARQRYQTYDKFRWGTAPGKNVWELPFITFREVLFYAYFVRIDPLAVIWDDILKLANWDITNEENLKLRHGLKGKLKEPCTMSLKELWNGKYARACIDIQINQTMNDAYLSSLGKQRDDIQKELDDIGSQPFDDLRFYLCLRDIYRQRWLHPTDESLPARIFNNHFLENDAMIENGETPKIW